MAAILGHSAPEGNPLAVLVIARDAHAAAQGLDGPWDGTGGGLNVAHRVPLVPVSPFRLRS
jgi:hypothetical protein